MPSIVQKLETVQQNAQALSSTVSENNAVLEKLANQNQSNADAELEVSSHIRKLLLNLNKAQKQIYEANVQNSHELQTHMANTLKAFSIFNKNLNDTLENIQSNADHDSTHNVDSALAELSATQTLMPSEIHKLLIRIEGDPNAQQTQSLILQLNDVLKELNAKTRGLFSK
jgi:hypothetical protein